MGQLSGLFSKLSLCLRPFLRPSGPVLARPAHAPGAGERASFRSLFLWRSRLFFSPFPFSCKSFFEELKKGPVGSCPSPETLAAVAILQKNPIFQKCRIVSGCFCAHSARRLHAPRTAHARPKRPPSRGSGRAAPFFARLLHALTPIAHASPPCPFPPAVLYCQQGPRPRSPVLP